MPGWEKTQTPPTTKSMDTIIIIIITTIIMKAEVLHLHAASCLPILMKLIKNT